MTSLLHGRNRLLFRSYLFLVGGLLVVALLLDLGFRQLLSRAEPAVDRWLESTCLLIESAAGTVQSADPGEAPGLFAKVMAASTFGGMEPTATRVS